jgi:hypothetical protein
MDCAEFMGFRQREGWRRKFQLAVKRGTSTPTNRCPALTARCPQMTRKTFDPRLTARFKSQLLPYPRIVCPCNPRFRGCSPTTFPPILAQPSPLRGPIWPALSIEHLSSMAASSMPQDIRAICLMERSQIPSFWNWNCVPSPGAYDTHRRH